MKKIIVNTTELKGTLARFKKIAMGQALRILSRYVNISYEKGELKVKVSDCETTMSEILTDVRVSENIEEKEKINLTVDFNTLYSLINRTTVGYTSFIIEEKDNKQFLTMQGNGEYKLELAYDERGVKIEFPNEEVEEDKYFEFNLNELIEGMKKVSSSIGTTNDRPFLKNYFVNNNIVLTSDGYRLSMTEIDNKNYDKTGDISISSQLGDLLMTLHFTEPKIYVTTELEEKVIYIKDKFIKIKAIINKEIEKFPFEKFLKIGNDVKNNTLGAGIVVNRTNLLEALGRIKFLTTRFEKNKIKMEIKEDLLVITDVENKGKEAVKIQNNTDFTGDFLINLEFIVKALKVMTSSFVNMYEMIRNINGIAFKEDNTINLILIIKKNEDKK
jgi:hypothetical protein